MTHRPASSISLQSPLEALASLSTLSIPKFSAAPRSLAPQPVPIEALSLPRPDLQDDRRICRLVTSLSCCYSSPCPICCCRRPPLEAKFEDNCLDSRVTTMPSSVSPLTRSSSSF